MRPAPDGASSRPPAEQVTLESSAFVLHQVIQWAREAGYGRVNVIGHSLGSIITTEAAATWPEDPSALVLTGVLHGWMMQIPDFSVFAAARLPGGQACDPGYIAVPAEMREHVLFRRGSGGDRV